MGYESGQTKGSKAALDINNVSEELELACAGLWVGIQNRRVK